MAVNPMCHHAIENCGISVYDEEALTALQLSAKTAGKMNEVIHAFNDLEESVPDIVADDVQDHIEKGNFDEQIGKHLGNLNQRVDNILGGLPENPTAMDAEVIDIRMDDNGNTYANAGTATRAQVGQAAGSAKAIVMFPNNGYIKHDGYDTETGYTRLILGGSTMYIIDPYTGKRHTLPISKISQQLPGFVYQVSDSPGQNTQTVLMLPPYQGYLGVKLGDTPTLVMEYGEGDKHFKVPHDVAPLLYFYYGQVDGPAMWSAGPRSFAGYATDADLAVVDDIVKGSIYLSAGATVGFEKYGTNGGLTVTVDGLLRVRFPSFSKKYTDWPSVCGDLDASIYTITNNRISVNLARYDYYLVYNVQAQALAVRTATLNLKPGDFILVQVGYGEPVHGALLDIHTRQTAESGVAEPFTVDDAKVGAFLKHFHSLDNKSAFIFFTDPHLCNGTDWESNAEAWMGLVMKYHNILPTESIICGGDWLTNGDTPEQAMYKGRYVMGYMDSKVPPLPNPYTGVPRFFLNAIGNHDTNEQGRADESAELWTGKMTEYETAKIWGSSLTADQFGCVMDDPIRMADGTNIIVLNSMGETSTMENFWLYIVNHFAELLGYGTEAPNSPENYIVVLHNYWNTDELTTCMFGSQVLQVCNNYNTNNRGTGRVKAVFCGHRHFDHNAIVGETPVIMTTHFQDGGSPTFDIVLVDNDTNAIHMYRIGAGENRVVEMAT